LISPWALWLVFDNALWLERSDAMILQICFILLIPLFVVILLVKINECSRWEWLETLFSKMDDILSKQRRRRKPVFEGVFVIFVVFGILVISKNVKPLSRWPERGIVVLADSTDWNVLEESLRHALERVVRTPQPEKTFSLKNMSHSDFFRDPAFRYVLIAATLESRDKTGEIIFDDLIPDPIIRRGIENGNDYLFVVRDRWGLDQIVVILVSNDYQTLIDKIETNRDSIYAIYDNDLKDCMKSELYTNRQEKNQAKQLMKSYGWTLEEQAELVISEEDSAGGFVSFSSWTPDRWMFVRWVEKGDTSFLNPEWVVQERNRLGKVHYGGNIVEERYFFPHRTTFLGRPALITSGLWGDDDPVTGGPFKNYTFFDSRSRRIYMIDAAVFNAGKKKLSLLQHLEIIAHTFRTEYDGKS